MNLKRSAAIVLAVLVVGAAVGWALRDRLAMSIAARAAQARLGTDALAALPDGLHVGLCGAGSPFPDERRSGPCTLVVAGTRMLVFDAGSGGVRTLARMGFDAGRIDAIFLTHFHSDHIDGLGEMMMQRWVGGVRDTPVPVHGPAGVTEVVEGFVKAYGADRGYRVAHHGEAAVPPAGFGGTPRPFDTGAAGRVVVLAEGDLEVVAFAVEHPPVAPAVGYRIRYKDRSVVLSGDTRRSDAVRREAQGVDLLVHDALSEPLLALLGRAAQHAGRPQLHKLFGDVVDYHASPEDAARTAAEARVGYLLLNHIVPPLPPLPGLEKAFLGRAPDLFTGPLRVGVDGDFVSLPAGTKRIDPGRRP
jgi:ribonuclease Z